MGFKIWSLGLRIKDLGLRAYIGFRACLGG